MRPFIYREIDLLMQRTGEWLKKLGAEVAFGVEDSNEGHGAFHRNPPNTNRALDWFSQNPE